MKQLILGVFAVLALSVSAFGGSSRQSTTVHVSGDYQTVCKWIEDHADQIEESSGAQVLETKGNRVKLQKDTEKGTATFWARRTAERGQYRVDFAELVDGPITDETTEITVSSADGGLDIKVRMTASVEGANSPRVAIGVKKSLRGIHAFLASQLGK